MGISIYLSLKQLRQLHKRSTKCTVDVELLTCYRYMKFQMLPGLKCSVNSKVAKVYVFQKLVICISKSEHTANVYEIYVQCTDKEQNERISYFPTLYLVDHLKNYVYFSGHFQTKLFTTYKNILGDLDFVDNFPCQQSFSN